MWRRMDLYVDTNVTEKHTVSIFRAEDEESRFLRNIAIYRRVLTASHFRRITLSSSPPWEPQISQMITLIRILLLYNNIVLLHDWTSCAPALILRPTVTWNLKICHFYPELQQRSWYHRNRTRTIQLEIPGRRVGCDASTFRTSKIMNVMLLQ
jgi:hypothetical protein